MKQKNKYIFWDITNLAIFYSVMLCFTVSSILGIVHYFTGKIVLSSLIYKVVLNVLVCLPYIIKKIFKITFSRVVGIVFYIFIFLAGFLGIELNFYDKFPFWDMIINFLLGAGLSVLSIYILNATVYKKNRNKHNLVFTFLFMICFSVSMCAIWEIGEFACDFIFNTTFQGYVSGGTVLVGKQALVDTMLDLLMNLFGAIFGVLFTSVLSKFDKGFLKSFYIKKLKPEENEVENIED